MMLIGHAYRVQMPAPDTLGKIMLYLMDFSGPIFFFISGMNVVTFVDGSAKKPGFDATKFYLLAAAALFLMGYPYNFNRGSIYYMDILQCVAICTAFVYLMMKSKLSVWSHLLIIASLYAIYMGFRLKLEHNQIITNFTLMRDAIPDGAGFNHPGVTRVVTVFKENFNLFERYTFFYFSFLPWIVFFYTGALWYREALKKPERQGLWIALFAGLLLIGPFAWRWDFNYLYLDSFVDLMVRGIPSYVFITLGGAGLITIFTKRKYGGPQSISNKWLAAFLARIELLGKESLLFLMVHWWVITSLMNIQNFYNHLAFQMDWPIATLIIPVRAVLSLGIMLFLLPYFIRLRNLLISSWQGVFGIVAAMVISAGLMYVFKPISLPFYHYLSYGLSIGCGFLYPWVRGKIRVYYDKGVSRSKDETVLVTK